MNPKSADPVHAPAVSRGIHVVDTDQTKVLEAEIQRLKAKLADAELQVRKSQADRDTKLHGLLIKLVELEPYPARYRELEARFRVTVAERDARILELEKRLAAAAIAPVDDPGTKRIRVPGLDRDDLKAIHGIGEQIETLLNSLGVRWYRQIARWSPEDVTFYSSRLDHFPGRISREEWVARARELHERKYGEKL